MKKFFSNKITAIVFGSVTFVLLIALIIFVCQPVLYGFEYFTDIDGVHYGITFKNKKEAIMEISEENGEEVKYDIWAYKYDKNKFLILTDGAGEDVSEEEWNELIELFNNASAEEKEDFELDMGVQTSAFKSTIIMLTGEPTELIARSAITLRTIWIVLTAVSLALTGASVAFVLLDNKNKKNNK